MNTDKIIDEAITLPIEERTEFLDKVCAGQPDLRLSIEAKISARQNGSTVEFNPSSVDLNPTLEGMSLGEDGTPIANDSVTFVLKEDFPQPIEATSVIAGRYTLLELLGEGGMGEVWVAQQTEPVKRKVALKLIKAGMDTKSVVQRFEQERQSLAMMDHPNIAKVLDGGLTQGRRPFFVMELVTGMPLNNYCDQNKLNIRERLQLFTDVCQAVQHAHQKGIIHRDLKPSNILVATQDGKPVPKVIDFGIAKAVTSNDSDANQAVFTQAGTVIGTLEYMAPEQANFSGEDIDTRADIYSLGVILYEMLTGLRPLDTRRKKKAAITEIIRIISEDEPAKPSSRVTLDQSGLEMASVRQIDVNKLQTLLKGELDWVVMKCLEKQRDRRYQTANALSRDIQRYLNDEIVEARPPSTSYRLKKLVKRYRVQVIAAGLVLLSLLGGIIGTTWGLIHLGQANRELAKKNDQLIQARKKADTRYDLARKALATFHTGVSEDFLLKEEKFKNLRDRLLSSADEFYANLGTLLKDDDENQSRRELLQANYDMANLNMKVGQKEGALQMHQRVLAEREKMLPNDPDAAYDVAQSLITIADLLAETGKTQKALEAYNQARKVVAGSNGKLPPNPEAQIAYAEAGSRWGYLLGNTQQSEEARKVLEEARDIQESLVAQDPENPERLTSLARTHHNLGRFPRNNEAEKEYQKALQIREKLVKAYPKILEYKSELARTHNNLASLYKDEGKTQQAKEQYLEALRIHQQLHDENPAVTEFAHMLAGTYRNYANLLADGLSSTSEAASEYRKGLDITARLVKENPTVHSFRSELAGGQEALGNLYTKSGNPQEAIKEYQNSLKELDFLVENNPDVPLYWNRRGYVHYCVGYLHSNQGKIKEAEGECNKALEDHRKLNQDFPKNSNYQYSLISDLSLLSDLQRKDHRTADAIASYNEAYKEGIKLVQDNPRQVLFKAVVADILRCRGLAYLQDSQKAANAVADTRQSLEMWESLPGRDGEQWFGTACCHAVLATLAGKKDSGIDPSQAKKEADLAMEILVKQVIPKNFKDISSFRNEPSLDILRTREDFKKLMTELGAK